MKLRTLAAVAALGLFLAVTGIASAGYPPWSGTFVSHMNNWDSPRIYTGYLKDGVTPVDTTAGAIYTPGGVTHDLNNLEWIDPVKADSANETSWGIFKFADVRRGEVDPLTKNNITEVGTPPGNILWTDGDASKQLVGVFYDRRDIGVAFTNRFHTDTSGTYTPENLFAQEVWSENTKYKMWYQPVGTYAEHGAGPNGRLAVDHYPGIGDVAGYTDHVLLGQDADTISTVFDPIMKVLDTDIGTNHPLGVVYEELASSTRGYIMLTEGEWLEGFQMAFPCGTASEPDAHLRIKSTLADTSLPNLPPGVTPWYTYSSDPITGTVGEIPEPVTMLGVLAGMSGLVGYIRKRRK